MHKMCIRFYLCMAWPIILSIITLHNSGTREFYLLYKTKHNNVFVLKAQPCYCIHAPTNCVSFQWEIRNSLPYRKLHHIPTLDFLSCLIVHWHIVSRTNVTSCAVQCSAVCVDVNWCRICLKLCDCSGGRVYSPIICQSAWFPWAYFTTCYISLPPAQLHHAFVKVSLQPEPVLFKKLLCHIFEWQISGENFTERIPVTKGKDKSKLRIWIWLISRSRDRMLHQQLPKSTVSKMSKRSYYVVWSAVRSQQTKVFIVSKYKFICTFTQEYLKPWGDLFLFFMRNYENFRNSFMCCISATVLMYCSFINLLLFHCPYSH